MVISAKPINIPPSKYRFEKGLYLNMLSFIFLMENTENKSRFQSGKNKGFGYFRIKSCFGEDVIKVAIKEKLTVKPTVRIKNLISLLIIFSFLRVFAADI